MIHELVMKNSNRALLLKNRQDVQDLKLWHQKVLVCLPIDYSLCEAKKGMRSLDGASVF